MTLDDDDPQTPIFELARKQQAAAAFGYRAGDVIEGKYQLVKLLERGRVTALWAVQDLVLDAQMALKMLANDGSDPEAAEHMLREARAAAAVEHPAFVRISDFGVTDRRDPFIVMELLRGESIGRLLDSRRRFEPTEAVRLLLPIAEALELAHSLGGVHRNISPESIVCIQGAPGRVQPKLIDFGMVEGSSVRSPEYQSPEQIADDSQVDQRSDIWAFSAVLYAMLAGCSPFHRDTPGMTRQAIVEDDALPLDRSGIFDEELSGIILCGLEKAPDARWETMGAYARALAGWLVGQGVDDDATGQSLRVIWLSGSPSTPPMAIDQLRENRHFPGAEEAYDVPKTRVWRTAAGIAGASVTLTAVFAAGALAVGAFGRSTSAAARSDGPRVAEGDQLGAAAPANGEPLADHEIAGAPDGADDDAGVREGGEAGARDASVDGSPDGGRPLARDLAPRQRWNRGTASGPTWQRYPIDRPTVLPTPQPPPDFDLTEPPDDDESGSD